MVQSFLEAPPGFEPGIRVLQTRALPLGYSAVSAVPSCKRVKTQPHEKLAKKTKNSADILERETRFEPATFTLAR